MQILVTLSVYRLLIIKLIDILPSSLANSYLETVLFQVRGTYGETVNFRRNPESCEMERSGHWKREPR